MAVLKHGGSILPEAISVGDVDQNFFANCQFSQLRDLCPLGMSMGGDGVRRASLERRASLLKSMEPTITIGFAEVAWGKRELSKLIFRRPDYGRGGLVDLSGSAQLHSLAGRVD